MCISDKIPAMFPAQRVNVQQWNRLPEVSAPEIIDIRRFGGRYFCTGSDFLVWRYDNRTKTEVQEN